MTPAVTNRHHSPCWSTRSLTIAASLTEFHNSPPPMKSMDSALPKDIDLGIPPKTWRT